MRKFLFKNQKGLTLEYLTKILKFSFLFLSLLSFNSIANDGDAIHLKPVLTGDGYISIFYFNKPQPDALKLNADKILYVNYSLSFDKDTDVGFEKKISTIISDAFVNCKKSSLSLARELFFDNRLKLLNEKSYQNERIRNTWVGLSELINNEIDERIIKFACRDEVRDSAQLSLDCEGDNKKDIYRFKIDFNSGGVIMDGNRHLLNPIISETAIVGYFNLPKFRVNLNISRINGKITLRDPVENVNFFTGECRKSIGTKF
jgi:hypothetical protein